MSLSPSPALSEHITRLSDALRCTIARSRPWLELLDHSAFSRPASTSDAATCIRKNLSYFRINYLTALAAVLAVSLLSDPFSLLTLAALLAAWLFLYLLHPPDQPIVAFGRSFSSREALWILIAATAVAVFLTNIGSLLMWTALIGIAIVCAHGAFRDPEDLFLDDQDLAGSGLLSFVNGGAAPPAASSTAAAPSVTASV